MKQEDIDIIQNYHENGEHEAIIDLIDSFDSMDYDAYCLRGRAWNNLGEPQKALEDLFAVEEQGKEDPLWHYRVMYSYDMMDENEKMIYHGKLALGYSPELDEDISLGMAYNYMEEGMLNEALEILTKYKLEQNCDWNNQMGRVHFMMNKYVEASMYLDQGIKLAILEENEDYAEEMAIGLYRCYEKLGKKDEMQRLEDTFHIKEMQIAEYSEEDLQIIGDHIEKHFGKFDMVMHELVSDTVHLDVALSSPNEERDHYVLTTMGMGAKLMEHMPPELIEKGYGRLELMITLPADWDVRADKEKWYWPLRWLKILGRLPFTQETWLGWGHTIPNGEPFAENTKLECMLLISPYEYGEGSYEAVLSNGERVHFLQLLPIYREEMDYKLAYGADALLDLFENDFSPVVDIKRKNYVPEEMRKKYFNWSNSPLKQ